MGNDDADVWDNAFPPLPGEDPSRVLQGRQLLYEVRSSLYKCFGAALGVQDGTITHPELPGMLNTILMESIECSHPYHVELQLRDIWFTLFCPTGMQASSEGLRKSFAKAALTKLLPTVARALDACWQRLQLPNAQAALG